jgi:hypothetical protein
MKCSSFLWRPIYNIQRTAVLPFYRAWIPTISHSAADTGNAIGPGYQKYRILPRLQEILMKCSSFLWRPIYNIQRPAVLPCYRAWIPTISHSAAATGNADEMQFVSVATITLIYSAQLYYIAIPTRKQNNSALWCV